MTINDAIKKFKTLYREYKDVRELYSSKLKMTSFSSMMLWFISESHTAEELSNLMNKTELELKKLRLDNNLVNIRKVWENNEDT